MEPFTPQLKEKLCQSITKELAQADTQENSPAATAPTGKNKTINDDLDHALQEHLRSIGKLFISQNLNPSDQLTNVLLLSKLKQYKSLQVMKDELESVQA